MLAPNAPLRPAVTAQAPEQDADAATLGPEASHEALSTAADATDPEPTGASRKARYLWAILLARIHEAFPLTDPYCAGEMRTVAFVTDPISIQAILAHIGEPSHRVRNLAPGVAQMRGHVFRPTAVSAATGGRFGARLNCS